MNENVETHCEHVKRKDFSEDIKLKCLLWSYRHCCLCDKACGPDIEIAHVDKNDDNSLDNAIPLCYDCHAEIGRYNIEHPRGNKYRPKELKTRREQIYEKYTNHLISPVQYKLLQIIDKDTDNPRVQFSITHLGSTFPLKTTITVEIFLGAESLGIVKGPYYSGKIKWNLNPQLTIIGNFSIDKLCINSTKRLRLEIRVTIIDIYDRPHKLLPVCYSYIRERNLWYLEPTSFKELEEVWKV